MSVAPDDLDSLLASLLAPPPASEPAPVAVLLPPELSAEALAVHAELRAWLESAGPGDIFNPPMLDAPSPEAEHLEQETLLELAAARAWQSGDPEAFEMALARLPADRAQHHRRVAGVCDLIKARQELRASKTPAPGGRS